MVGRRDLLRGAAVAGTGAFVVPTIVTVDPADAQALTSPPPEPSGSPGASGTPQVTGTTDTGTTHTSTTGTTTGTTTGSKPES
ncbi:MAG: twin-arginine translocation signal domain-containing protein [Acidimicrobiales bacterium]